MQLRWVAHCFISLQVNAVTKTWCVLFRLKKDDLLLVAKSHASLDAVFARMRRLRAKKLMRVARLLIIGQRTKFISVPKLFVQIESGAHLPKMDGVLGLCDPFAVIGVYLGESAEPVAHKELSTTVQYNTLNPVWNETFIFTVDFHIPEGMPVFVRIHVKDHDEVIPRPVAGANPLPVSPLSRFTARERP